MSELHQLGKQFYTDKTDIRHNGKSYLDFYEPYFKPIRDDNLSILELGVKDGGSLKLWQAYFPNAHILGVDVDPDRAKHSEGRIDVVICSQDNQPVLDVIASKYGGFDIILDDASHLNALTIRSFEILSKHLRKGGIYIFEDMLCSYAGDMRLEIKAGGWPGMNYQLPEDEWINVRETMNTFFNGIIRSIDSCNSEWDSIHFHPMTTILRKK